MYIRQSEATADRRRILFVCQDEAGAPVTGQTFSAGEIRISKNGEAEANSSGTVTEIGGGEYYYTATQTEVNTLGFFAGRVNKTGVAPNTFAVQIVDTELTVAETAGAVWNATASSYNTGGSMGALQNGGVQASNASALLNRIRKNIAFNNFLFNMVGNDGRTPVTGASITATRLIDGGTFGACSNAATEVSNGWYRINLSASDLNGDCIILRFTATGALPYQAQIITQPA